jgi:hypothetical protein
MAYRSIACVIISYPFALCQHGELHRMYGSASSEDASQLKVFENF